MTDKQNEVDEILQSIAAAAADIQRWTLYIAMSRRISPDRRIDIANAAARIADLNRKLREL